MQIVKNSAGNFILIYENMEVCMEPMVNDSAVGAIVRADDGWLPAVVVARNREIIFLDAFPRNKGTAHKLAQGLLREYQRELESWEEID